ncbi:unnamed protein product [Trichobilharzia regenti]|nr:unnamed protein product [Trichobilharzia regenti]
MYFALSICVSFCNSSDYKPWARLVNESLSYCLNDQANKIETVISRPLTTQELPLVIDVAARHMACFHKLCMPFSKTPSFIMKMLSKYLDQLTDTPEHLHRPRPKLSTNTLSQLAMEGFSFANDGHMLTEPSYDEAKSMVYRLSLIDEFNWLK